MKKGPVKQFFTTVTFRVRAEEKKRWEEAKAEDPQGLDMSKIARGLLNKWADKVLGDK